MASPTPSNELRRPTSNASTGSIIHVASRLSSDTGVSVNASRQSSPLSDISSRSTTPVASSMTSCGTKKDNSKSYGSQGERLTKQGQESRNVSGLTGATLISDSADDNARPTKKRKMQEEEDFPADLPPRIRRRGSVKETVKRAASKVKSVLGKRKTILRQLDTGNGGLLEELDLDSEEEERAKPSKRVKHSDRTAKLVKKNTQDNQVLLGAVKPVKQISQGAVKPVSRRGKAYLSSGLFAGQSLSAGVTKKEKSDVVSAASQRNFMPMPMFGFLEHNKDFTIPFDVFAPSLKKGDEKPKDWHQLNRNRLVGEAKDLWEKDAPLARSLCICAAPSPYQQGCDENCLNRLMHYECDDNNCGLPPDQCSNREFTSLAKRVKKGGAFDVGVEVLKTPNRGFGVRACREFAPGEIIMEYTGEIISEAECQRRMHEVYAGKHCYYIMEFDQGFHIDGTKGSMARFVNHSCEPNCEVRMVKVSGTPRMAIFAGEQGVFTGEELTYDYNFDNFGDNKQACYCGAATCRGHLARRLNAAEQKIRDHIDRERQLEAEKEARRLAAEQQHEKLTKAKRGSNWRGWVSLSEVKDDLRHEKAAREAAEKHSSRAQRLAARRSSVAAPTKRQPPVRRKPAPSQAEPTQAGAAVEESLEAAPARKPSAEQERTTSITSKTGVSKFSEHLPADGEPDTFVSHSFARVEAIERALASDNAVDLATDGETGELTKSTISKTSTSKATSMGRTILRTVEKAVVEGLKQGKVKVMRQSTLSFGKTVS